MKIWLVVVFSLSFYFISVQCSFDHCSLRPYFKIEPALKLKNFSAKKNLSAENKDLLELWESILTGRSAPVARWMKDQYRTLGLNHLFTPSGFHLTAVLSPFLRFIDSQRIQFWLLIAIGILLKFMPGQGALKRMVTIKTAQKHFGLKSGFILALVFDMCLGTFQESSLSFTYSFLFLGIVYSGLEGFSLIPWFFFAQLLLAYFQGLDVSPLLLIFSPILNLAFGLSMPFLFILAIPLWDWQMHSGLFLLRCLQTLVNGSAEIIRHFPMWEVNAGLFLILMFFLLRRWKTSVILLLLFCSSLDQTKSKVPSIETSEFVPRGPRVMIINKEEEDLVYFKDGKCSRKLVNGFWWEKCSPSRGSGKKLRKLSYPS